MPNPQQNIYLIGPMGAGKSSVGVQLAKLLGKEFYDSDAEIKKRTGVEISWIFAKEGEAGFRVREAAMIAELTELNGVVLSTGAGAIVTASVGEVLQNRGHVVYLQVSLEEQIRRTANYRGHRPLIEEADDRNQALIELNNTRAPLYQQLANITYVTDQLDPRRVAQKIIADLF